MNYIVILLENGGTIGYLLSGLSILSGTLIIMLVAVLPFRWRLASRQPRTLLGIAAPNAVPMAALREIPKVSSTLGLLGTVMGVISAFASMKGRPEMSVLSGYLSMAMITTWAGLGIAAIDQTARFIIGRLSRRSVAAAAERLGVQESESPAAGVSELIEAVNEQRDLLAAMLDELRKQSRMMMAQSAAASPTQSSPPRGSASHAESPYKVTHDVKPMQTRPGNPERGRNGTGVVEIALPGGEKCYARMIKGTTSEVLMVDRDSGQLELVSPQQGCTVLGLPTKHLDRLNPGGSHGLTVRTLEGQEAEVICGLFEERRKAC